MARNGKLVCICCGENKSRDREYFGSLSPLHKQIEVIPVCKSCLNDCYNELVRRYDRNSTLAAKRLMEMFDVYWDEDWYKSAYNNSIKNGGWWLGEYMKLKAMNKAKGSTSMDNINRDGKDDYIARGGDGDMDLIDEDLIEKWGEGYTAREYAMLEKKYKTYIKEYPSNTLQHRNIIKSICELENERTKARLKENSTAYTSFDKQISTKMAELDVIPAKQKRLDEDSNVTFGLLMKAYETTEPVMDAQDVYKDVDFIDKYFNRIFAKPFAIAMGLAKGDYSLEEGDKNIEFTEEFKEIKSKVEEEEDGN